MSSYDPLIYGRLDIKNIVSCEFKNGVLELYIETPDGIKIEYKPANYWIVTDKPYGEGCERLKGDLTYKYIKKIADTDEFNAAMKWFYNNKDRTKYYTVRNSKESPMVYYGFTYYKGMTVDQVSVLSFDIETNGIKLDRKSRVFLISNTYRKNGKLTRKLFSHDEYDNDGDMIEAWCDWVREMNPSILLGHNIYGFDIPYLVHTADLYDKELILGRNDTKLEVDHRDSRFRKDGSQFLIFKNAYAHGREIVDTMFLSYKYDIGRKYDSYGLKNIIKQEGLEKEGRQFYDASTIQKNYNNPEEWKKIKEYAIDDADDSLKLFDLMIPAFFYMTQAVPKSLQSILTGASGSQLNSLMVRSYLQDGHSLPEASDVTAHVEGGISFGIPGIYRNCQKWDIKSAYPSQILRLELYDKNKDPNKNFYKMVKFFTLQRFEYKRLHKETNDRHYIDLDAAAKQFINSAYGLTNTPGLLFNSSELAAIITKETREVIKLAIKWSTSKDIDYWWKKDEGIEDEDS